MPTSTLPAIPTDESLASDTFLLKRTVVVSHERTAAAPQIGKRLGKYLLTARLGQGSEGQVFRALHVALGLDRAIKLLNPQDCGSQRIRERLHNEARLLSRIEHNNIVRVFDLELDDERPYFVMEFVEGLNLAELIAQSGRIAVPRIVNVITQIANGLRAAARFGVVHRDIKPANILLTKDGTAKLTDLGTGFLIGPGGDDADGAGSKIVGTPYYMPPEQLEGGQVDHRSDIYALGATFYHAVTGQLPFEGGTLQQLLFKKCLAEQRPELWTAPEVHCPEIGTQVSAVITKMMAPNRDRRYPGYDELLADLTEMQRAAGVTAAVRATQAVDRARITERLATMQSPPLRGLAESVRTAMDALARGDKRAAREAIAPHKQAYSGNEAVWLLLAKSAERFEEALELAEAGVRAVPASERLRALVATLKKPASPKKCLFCSATDFDGPKCRACHGFSAFPQPKDFPRAAPPQADAIRKAIVAYERAARERPDVKWEHALGLAYLSVAQPRTALSHLDRAVQGGCPVPGDRLDALRAWVADAEAAARRVRIAVIDDSPTIRKLVQSKLAEFDFAVLEMCDGDEAIAKLPEYQPHLILLDINMPGKDGYQVCRWIKAHPTLRPVPVVLLSGDDGFIDKVRGKMAGAARHIGKPFNGDELLQVIDNLCAKSRRKAAPKP